MFLEQRGEQFEQQSVLKEPVPDGHLRELRRYADHHDRHERLRAGGRERRLSRGRHAGGLPASCWYYDTWKDSFAISAEMIEDAKLHGPASKQPAAFMTGLQPHARDVRRGSAGQRHPRQRRRDAVPAARASTSTARGRQRRCSHTAHPPEGRAATTSATASRTRSAWTRCGKLETAMHLFRGDNDEILDVAPDTIVIPENADLKKAVFAAIGADKDPVSGQQRLQLPVRPLDRDRLDATSTSSSRPARSPGCCSTASTTRPTAARCGTTASSSRCARPSTRTPTRTCGAAAAASTRAFNDWRAFAAVGGIASGNELP